MSKFIAGVIAGLLIAIACVFFFPLRWLVAVGLGLWLLQWSVSHMNLGDDELPPPV